MSALSQWFWDGVSAAGWRRDAGLLRRCRSRLAAIAALEPALEAEDDSQLLRRSLALRFRARSGVPLDELLDEGFALVREAARRQLGMRHFDVQLIGGMVMCQRGLAEMETGEGKTLTATLPMYLFALAGRGAHLATTNDYLARRDAQWMRPIYECLGLTVGVVETATKTADRRRAYACDVTYGTAKEFGFDFLRDRLRLRSAQDLAAGLTDVAAKGLGSGEPVVQRAPNMALVDEADSVLLDDACTPLIISVPNENQAQEAACYSWAAQAAPQFEEETDFTYDARRRQVTLTMAGRRRARELPQPDQIRAVDIPTLHDFLERAIKVDREFTRDQHYVIRDGEIQIVDESTGRVTPGRQWRDGIHQAIEAREQLVSSVLTGQAARVTLQEYFLRYPHLAGMTGTASSSSREFRRVYRLDVVTIPTNRPARREMLPPRVFGTADERWLAVVDEVRQFHDQGRPVLIGTRSIDKSELLSRLLDEAGIPHTVLNARHEAREAEIVAQAAQRGSVTVATNMAGRGTDIKLGPGVAELGGLHVVCTEIHDSARIDRQLIGRCGRQGDPGSYRQFMSLDDEVLSAGLGEPEGKRLKELGRSSRGPFDHLRSTFVRAQRAVERKKYKQRRVLLYHEREQNRVHRELGLDPYLDAPT